MSAKQSRRARADAHAWAAHNGVWRKYPTSKLSWWKAIFRKIADLLFPQKAEVRKRGEDKQRGWWYRRVLKHAAHYFADPETKRDAEIFARAKKKVDRNWREKHQLESSTKAR